MSKQPRNPEPRPEPDVTVEWRVAPPGPESDARFQRLLRALFEPAAEKEGGDDAAGQAEVNGGR